MVKVILWALLIFISRSVDVALGTLRTRMVVSRRKYRAAIIGFFEVLIYILIVSKVIQDTGNIFNVIAYCAGFSCGTILGLNLEDRLNLEMLQATIMLKDNSYDLLRLIKEAGFKATLSIEDFKMDIINVLLEEKRKDELEKIINDLEYDTLISFQSLNKVSKNYLYSLKK